MIVSASYRTDVPAFYGAWFLNRLAAGVCRVVNPYGGRPYEVRLERAAVDGFVFWTRHVGPFLDGLAEVGRRGFPFVVQHTINAYPRALEPSAPEAAAAVANLRLVARAFGRRAAVWRYDPVLVSSLTPLEWHLESFARLAAGLEGTVDEVTVSFAQIYRKTRRGLDAAARQAGFVWRDPEAEEKRALVGELAAIAAGRGMALTLCAQPELVAGAAAAARCIDAARLAEVAGAPIAAREKGNREGCLCHESRDIGAYDSCPMGCVYCYAVGGRGRARARFKAHDPTGEFLSPPTPGQPAAGKPGRAGTTATPAPIPRGAADARRSGEADVRSRR